MSKETSLIKNTAIVTFGKICTQLISFLLLPLYTALLTTEEYGIVDLLNTLINLIVPILILQLDQGIFRYLIDCRNDTDKENQLISVTIFFTISQVVLYTILFLFIKSWINNDYKYFLLINLILSLLSNLVLQISRGLGDNSKYAIGSFLVGSITVIINVLLVAMFKFGAYGMLWASLIGNGVCTLYVFISLKLYKRIKRSFYNKEVLRKLLKYSVPLIPNVISWWVVTASDRIIISSFMNLSANGVYSAANKFSGVITTLYSVFNLTWTESASINIDSEDRDSFFSKILSTVLQIFGSVCLLTISLMPFVFPMMFNIKFQEAYMQIPILIIGTLFNILISFYGSIYVAKKMTKEIAKTSIFAAVINIVVNCVFIKYIGLFAASLSTAISYFTMFVYRNIDSRKYVHLNVKKSLIYSMIFVYAMCVIFYYLNIYLLNIISIILSIVYVTLINKHNILKLVKFIKLQVHYKSKY